MISGCSRVQSPIAMKPSILRFLLAEALRRSLPLLLLPVLAATAAAAEGTDENVLEVDPLRYSDIRKFLQSDAEKLGAFAAMPPQYLSISDTLRMALAHNLALEITRVEPLVQAQLAIAEEARFDPVLGASVRQESFATPQNFQDFISSGGQPVGLNEVRIFEQDNLRFRTGVDGLLPYGTEYSLEYRGDMLENTLTRTSPDALFLPEYAGFVGLTLRQPIMRNFGRDVNEAGIRIRRLDERQAYLDWELELIAVVSATLERYYDLVFAFNNVLVRIDGLELAQTLLEANQARYDQGEARMAEVSQAQLAVSQRTGELLRALQNVVRQQNSLKRVLSDDGRQEMPALLVPTANLSAGHPNTMVNTDLYQALQKRPEYKRVLEEIEKQGIRVTVSRNQILPRVDIEGSVGVNGLAGTFPGSLEETVRGQGPQWSIGVVVSMPWGNREGRANLAAANQRLRQIETRLKDEEVSISLELDTSSSEVRVLWRALQSARQTRLWAEEALKNEQALLDEGYSTTFEVLRLQTDQSEARVLELESLADYHKARVRLLAARGELLENYGIRLADEYAGGYVFE